VKRLLIVAALIVLPSCPAGTAPPEETRCKVEMFEAHDEPPVCAIVCSWVHYNQGFSNSTPVPCRWFGKAVTRR